MKAYYQSKLAQVMYTLWLAKRLEGTTVKATAIRVPSVKVDPERLPKLSKPVEMLYRLKAKMAISTEEMADTYIRLATDGSFSHMSGKYFDENCREVAPNKYCRDENNIASLINLTAGYLEELKVNAD